MEICTELEKEVFYVAESRVQDERMHDGRTPFAKLITLQVGVGMMLVVTVCVDVLVVVVVTTEV